MKFLPVQKCIKIIGFLLAFLTITLSSITGCAHSMSLEKEMRNSNNSTADNITSKNDNSFDQMISIPLDLSQTSRIEIFTITIPQLGNRQRNIQVYLPPDYDSSGISYPVIYLHDGASLFNPPPTRVGDWLIDETLDRLFNNGSIKGMIAVGIEYDADYPWSEYTPWINNNMYDWVKRDNSESVEGGEGFAFLEFIVNTLKPEIDSRYRTLSDRDHTAIGGSCRIGLIPLLAGLMRPDVFSRVMAMSPSVWLAEGGGRWLSNNQLINYMNNIDIPKNVKFYLDVGTEESSGNRPPVKDQDGKRITYPQAYIEGAEIVYNTLVNKGVPNSNINFRIIDGAVIGRDEWAKRFDSALLWLLEETEVFSPTPTSTPSPSQTATETSTPSYSQTPTLTSTPLPTYQNSPIPTISTPTIMTASPNSAIGDSIKTLSMLDSYQTTPTIVTEEYSPQSSVESTEIRLSQSEPSISIGRVNTHPSSIKEAVEFPENKTDSNVIARIILAFLIFVPCAGFVFWYIKKRQIKQ